MTAAHDPAKCDAQACPACDGYSIGYVAGKTKAHFELRAGDWKQHDETCNCAPCLTVRSIMFAVCSGERVQGVVRELVRLELRRAKDAGCESWGWGPLRPFRSKGG